MIRNRVYSAVACLVSVVTVVYLLAEEPARPVSPTPQPGPVEKPKADAEPADNSYCYVCHANYDGEELADIHQPVGVGCEKCHGQSLDHSGDEDSITPPDRMFLKPEIIAYCLNCHDKEDLIGAQEEHAKLFQETKPDKVCTDCHGEKHRLKVRTRIWDKKTRKLVKDDGVRMMSSDPTGGAASKPPQE
jgi:hypothetical protein